MKNFSIRTALIFAPLLLIGCQKNPQSSPIKEKSEEPRVRLGPPVADTVTRAQAIATARAYLLHEWKPSEKNVYHGVDADGIRVDTPDHKYKPIHGCDGWWVPGAWNRSIPYQWGGFATPDEFDRDIAAGKWAGDVYTSAKRQGLESAVSKNATGIDCSGFVSRCWKLPRAYSTRELPSICTKLDSYDDLLPGDILNTHNNHVLLFEGWSDPERHRLNAYETGSPPTWKVFHHAITLRSLKALGYEPYRYKGIRD